MSKIVNGEDSIITSAPNLHSLSSQRPLGIPKPFEKFSHLQETSANSSNDSLKSPALVSPHNQAWLDSPNGYIGSIPESNIMSKCIAFVDVWSSDRMDNRSLVFARILNRMGATIAKKFTKQENITHLVFVNGHKSYLQKAKKRGVFIINCIWVERCKVTQTWVDETPFLFDGTNYKPPKKFREMQPLDPEEERIRSAERAKRRQKKEERKNAKKGVAFLSPLITGGGGGSGCKDKRFKANFLASDTPYRRSPRNYLNPLLVSETPSESILRKIQRMREGKPIFSPPSSPVSESSQHSFNATEYPPPPELSVNAKDTLKKTSSPPSSDMDLTCLSHDQIDLAKVTEGLHVRDIANHTRNSLSNSENSQIRLHLSDSSVSFSNDASDQVVNSNKTNSPSPHKVITTRTRRKLCDEEVTKPASFLQSPCPRVEPFIPRRSKRLSGVIASRAISRMYRPEVLSESPDVSSTSTDSTYSTLPPPGSTINPAANSNGFFAALRYSTSSCDRNAEISDDTRSAKSRQSFSTSYEDNNRGEDEEEEPRVRSIKHKRKSKETKESKTSSTSNNERPRKSLKKTKQKRTRREVLEGESAQDKENILRELIEAPKPRRSTEEFSSAPLNEICKSTNHKARKQVTKHSVLVLTNLHSHERVAMEKIVRRLGRFRVQPSVKDHRTSHVICGEARRTLNVLHAIARGLWLLSKDWLLDSMRAGEWLDEEEYEVDFFPAARKARLLRNGLWKWSLPLFDSLKGFVYVSPETKPPTEELCELVTKCGGHVIHSPRRARIRVGHWVARKHSLPAVKETWVLDSITETKLKPTKDYRIT